MEKIPGLIGAAVEMATAAGMFSGGSGPGMIDRFNAWIGSENGNKFIAALDRFLESLGINIVIAIRKKAAA